jgi:spermidine/putrescine transport system ATP-binding protein
VRPERVRLADALRSASGVNTLTGVLAGVSHLGHTLQLVVTTPSGRELLVRAPRSAATPSTLGEPVTCTWDSTDVHAFPATPHPTTA